MSVAWNRFTQVALRKESVDRNIQTKDTPKKQEKSLSARRAWIEIIMLTAIVIGYVVALRKESVDRNITRIRTVIGCV